MLRRFQSRPAISLALIAAIHLLTVIWLTRTPAHERVPDLPERRSALVFFTLPPLPIDAAVTPRAQPTPPRPTMTALAAPPRQRRSVPPPAATLPAPTAPVPSPARAEPDPFAAVAAPAAAAPPSATLARSDGYLMLSKENMAAIDRDLRAKTLTGADRNPIRGESRLAKGIAAAYKERGDGSMETITNADGSRITKVHGALGTYCVTTPTNTNLGGRDAFKDVRNGITNCPP